VDIFFPRCRLWINCVVLLGTFGGAACSRHQAARPAADPDEEMVEMLEETGRIADRHGADCERWADEQVRLLGTGRLERFNKRLLAQSDQQRAAFHAKYADRIDPWQEKVARTSERCGEVLKKALLRRLEVHTRPDAGP